MARVGRPPKFDEPTQQVTFILPERVIQRCRERISRLSPDVAEQSDSLAVQTFVMHCVESEQESRQRR